MSHELIRPTRKQTNEDSTPSNANGRNTDFEGTPESLSVDSGLLDVSDYEIFTPGETLVTIDELPPELLSKIFVRCLDGFPVRLSTRELMGMPWTLGLVSSHWRHVALSEPRLWNNLAIEYPRYPPAPFMMFFRKILARCRNVPLNLAASLPSGDVAGSTFTDLVIPYLHQVSTLWLYFHEECFPAFLNLPFDILESATFIIGFSSARDPLSLHNQSPIFSVAPNLRRVEITSHASTNLLFHKIGFPWAQLTEIEIRSDSFLNFNLLDVLRQCLKLRSLHFFQNGFGSLHRDNLDSSDINLPLLESLDFSDDDVDRFCAVLDYLTLPSLKALMFPGFNSLRQFDCVVSLLERSQCEIKALGIGPYAFENAKFRCMEILLPRLRELNFSSPTFPKILLPIIQGHRLPTVERLTGSVMTYNGLFELLEGEFQEVESGFAAWQGPSFMDFKETKYHLVDHSMAERISSLELRAARLGLELHMSPFE